MYKVYSDIRRGIEKRRQTTVVSRINACMLLSRANWRTAAEVCSLYMRDKLAGSLDVGFGRDGRRCRSLRR